MEQLFVQCFILVFGSCGQENVTTNKLMNHFAVTAQAAESYGHILVKLYGYLQIHLEIKIKIYFLTAEIIIREITWL